MASAEAISPDVNQSAVKAYTLAREGKTLSLFATLQVLTSHDRRTVLQHKTVEYPQHTTPFLIAARNGHTKVVSMLLDCFPEYIDIEQVGTVKFDGFVIEGATALWCASGAGNFEIVQLLLKHNVDINHTTETRSTPLRAACFDGYLDIVKLLVENGADFEIANRFDNTCLMIASYKGHTNVARYLLERGANPDAIAHCGATAMHFAVERGHISVVGELIRFNAVLIRNKQGLTPLDYACNCNQSDIVDFFLLLPSISVQQRIDAMELLGASYANAKDSYDIEKCHAYLLKGMKERYKDSKNIIQKKLTPPVEAYENRGECLTIEELESIKDDHNALHMESLIIRERILGENNIEIPHPIIYRGAVFADTSQFDRCITLWTRALELRQNNDRIIHKDLLRFAQVFSQMLRIGETVNFTVANRIFEACLQELSKAMAQLKRGSGVLTEDSDVDKFEMNVHTTLYFIILLLKIAKTEQDNYELCRLVYRFNQLKVVLYTNSHLSPLHIACNQETHVDDFHVNDVVKFPNAALVKLLLQCGAPADSLDLAGNTPLHTIVRYDRPISDFMTLHNIIALLLSHGAHLDRVNSKRETAFDVATTGVAEIIMKTRRKISLKCIASQVVKKHKLEYKGHIPVTLEEFVDIH